MVTIVLRGVKTVRYRTADGRETVYYYHRKTGARLDGDPQSRAFLDQLEVLNAAPAHAPSRHASGSLGALTTEYKAAPDFTQLSHGTKIDYLRYISRLETIWGQRPVRAIELKHVTKLRDTFAATPRTANYIVQVLRLLLEFGRRHGYLDHNPAIRPKLLRTGEGHRPAEEDEIARFRRRWGSGTLQRVAFELLLNSAQRGEDVIAMTRPHYRRGRLWVMPEKTRRSTGKRIDIPASADLRAVLDPYLKTHEHLTLLVTPGGRPFKVDFFRHFMRAAYEAAGLPADFTTHGLRYAGATRLHELEVDWGTIGEITGHETAQMVRRYTGKRRATRLAISRLDRATRGQKANARDKKSDAV